MSMFKSCSRCGKIHKQGEPCPVRYKCTATDESRLRNTNAWHKKSLEIREKANYLCEVCKDGGLYTYNSLEVHHITKLKDNPNGLLDDLNLICLCVTHHKQADNNEIDKDYLKQLARHREGYGE